MLSRLSKTFQRQYVDFTAVSDGTGVESTVAALNSFKLAPGPRLQKVMSEVPDEHDLTDSFYFKKQKVSDSITRQQAFSRSKVQFLEKLIENLLSRFPDNGLLSAFLFCILRSYPVVIVICPHTAFVNLKPSVHTMDNQKPQNLVSSSSHNSINA